MANEFAAPILSYEQINNHAAEFLKQKKKDTNIPVDIEKIVEFDLSIDIFPFPNLQKTYDVEGFISGDLTTIYVDEFIYNNRPTRYRCSLAHEVGHCLFHKELMSAVHPRSISEWKRFVLGVDDDTYGWIEYQAYTFASAVLMPRSFLKELYDKEIELLKPKVNKALDAGLSKEIFKDYIIDAVVPKLAKLFDVSPDVATRRITKEIEMHHLSLSVV